MRRDFGAPSEATLGIPILEALLSGPMRGYPPFGGITMTDTPRWRRYLRFFGRNIEAGVQDEPRFHRRAGRRQWFDHVRCRTRGSPCEDFGAHPASS